MRTNTISTALWHDVFAAEHTSSRSEYAIAIRRLHGSYCRLDDRPKRVGMQPQQNGRPLEV